MNLEHTVIAICGFIVGFAVGCGLIGVISSARFMNKNYKKGLQNESTKVSM